MILLDTCVISEFAKPSPDPAVLAWMERVSDDSLRLSVLTLGEIQKGADLLGRRSGRARPPIDALLAATAVCHQLTLATRNVADFEGTGAVVVNPWDATPG